MRTALSAVHALLNRLRPSPRAVADVRGRRFVAVIDCMLNQNARDCGAARWPALNVDVVDLCHAYRVGILQMPCPEIAALGIKRIRRPGQSLRDALAAPAASSVCKRLASETADRLEAYLDAGYALLAVLGGNPRSPGCAVGDMPGDRADSGVFIGALQAELRRRGRSAEFHAIRDGAPEWLADDLRWLEKRFAQSPD